MPDTKRATAELRRAGQLELVYVATDTPDTADQMRGVMRDVGFSYTNLYNGSYDFKENCLGWQPGGNHHNYLINPLGVIVAKDLYMPELKEVLTYFVSNHDSAAAIGVRAGIAAAADGAALISAELSSPQRQPLRVEVDYAYVVQAADGSQQLVHPAGDEAEVSRTVSFAEWSDAVELLDVPAQAGAVELRYEVRVLIPGTEALCGGQGVWASERGRLKLQ